MFSSSLLPVLLVGSMAQPSHFSFLLLSGFCFSLATALILPPLPLTRTTTITSNLNTSESNWISASMSGFSAPAANLTVMPSLELNEKYSCYTSSPYVYRPSYDDCTDAILQIPDDNDMRTFYSGRAGPELSRLPLEKRHGSCKILIDLKSRAMEEQETWSKIWNRATQLNVICLNPSRLQVNYGGFTQAGQRGRIRISLTFATDTPDVGKRGSNNVA
ncbi:hypothetical protein N7G274_009766 [Stereocaulon virgatum]|uniref:Uncharacterized protein n=1 Tax=Stereocaulon virgatum TaxID=373712 RepID=A0ABR3ZXJ6_9LECA